MPCRAATQAKFRIPRNQTLTKENEGAYRPQLHVVGCLVAGICECFFLMDADQPKSSDMQQTILARVLDIVDGILRKDNLPMPANLLLAADNTTREHRNQHLLKFLAKLVSCKQFLAAENGYMMVGHTHNKLDQRFGTIACGLARQQVLETPEDTVCVGTCACVCVPWLVACSTVRSMVWTL